MHRKTTENYLVTSSVKRMHPTKKSLSNISVSDLQSGIVSLTGSEFESHMSHGATFYELQRSFAVSGIQASFDEERKRN